MVMSEKQLFIMICNLWIEKKSFKNFKLLYHYGFRNNPNPVFRLWRIFRNTVNGRYREIATKGYEAW